MPNSVEQKPVSSSLRREPKHVALVRDISSQIRSGELRPGDQLPSFNELRERWGVGRDTLERMYKSLEEDGLISREHRRGIFVAYPGQAKRQGTIGFVTPTALLNHPYYVHLLQGVRHGAELADVEVLLVSERNSVRWEKMDGLIYQATMHNYMERPPGMPAVVLVKSVTWVDSVMADDSLGITQAIEHLWSLGHRRIAFLTNEGQPHTMSEHRWRAYQDFATRYPESKSEWLRILADPGIGNKSWEEVGYEDMRRWLSEDWKELGCTAILAHNDETAIGVIAALQEAGLRVPQDVSVVGFDGTDIAYFHRPRLSTVKVPLFEIGLRGFQTLMQQIEQPVHEANAERLAVRLMLPTQFQPGQSTGPVS